MKVSVVIPTYNRRDLLSQTLPTTFEQTCSQDAYEVIVVVDGSTDGTVEMLGQLRPPCKLHVLEQPNRGQAAARNAGLRAARGDLVLFLDDDLLCEPNLVSEHIAAHQSGENCLVFGPVDVSPESPPTLATKWTRRLSKNWIERLDRDGFLFPVDAVVGPNTSAPVRTLLELGGFDEDRFNYAQEDFEFGLRLWQAGIPLRYHRAAVTHQLYVKSTRYFIRSDSPLYGKSETTLFRKHPQLRRFSELGRYSEAGLAKRFAKACALAAPVPFDLLASIPCWLAERLPGNKRVEQLGLRMLSARRNLTILRSAVKHTGGWRRFHRAFGVRVPVLLFHNVGPFRPGTEPSLTVSPDKFQKRMLWLKRHGYVGISCFDWMSWLRGEKTLPEKPVVLTFDDAYADIAEHALPVLKTCGFSATVFVVTDEIGGTNQWDQKTGSTILHCMSLEQIRHWAAEGFEFGAHTRTHPDLITLTDREMENEVGGSGIELSRLLGEQVHSFAYPFGHYCEAVKKHAERAFDIAVSCENGLNGLSTDPFLLRRSMVSPNDLLLDFAFYLHLGFTPLNHLRRLRQRFRFQSRSLYPREPISPPAK